MKFRCTAKVSLKFLSYLAESSSRFEFGIKLKISSCGVIPEQQFGDSSVFSLNQDIFGLFNQKFCIHDKAHPSNTPF